MNVPKSYAETPRLFMLPRGARVRGVVRSWCETGWGSLSEDGLAERVARLVDDEIELRERESSAWRAREFVAGMRPLAVSALPIVLAVVFVALVLWLSVTPRPSAWGIGLGIVVSWLLVSVTSRRRKP